MELLEAIRTRRSVRKFTEEVPPVEDVKKIIDAARLAPSSTNDQMWHFKAIYNKDIKDKMRQAVVDKFDEMLTWEEARGYVSKIKFYKHYSIFFTDAPVNIAVIETPRKNHMGDLMTARGISKEEMDRLRPDTGLLSIGAAIQNLSLVAHELGYGTCWMTAPLYAYKELEEIIGIPEGCKLVSIVCLGRPADDKKGPPKKPLEEVLTIVE